MKIKAGDSISAQGSITIIILLIPGEVRVNDHTAVEPARVLEAFTYKTTVL